MGRNKIDTPHGVKDTGAESTDYRWRPDPDEPWRFRCPDCGSTAVNRRPTTQTEERRFLCGQCHEYWRESQLDDRAAGDSNSAGQRLY